MKQCTNLKPKDNTEQPRLRAKKTIQQEQPAETLNHIAKVPQREDRWQNMMLTHQNSYNYKGGTTRGTSSGSDTAISRVRKARNKS